MRVIVCGGRQYKNYARVTEVLNLLHGADPIEMVIQGGAEGADKLAAQWAHDSGVMLVTVPALWGFYGTAAGPIRNKNMLKLLPTHLVVFPGGKGTQNMISLVEQEYCGNGFHQRPINITIVDRE